MLNTKKASMLTDLHYNIIDFHVTLQRSVAALHQPFYNEFGIGTDSRLRSADEGDSNA